LAGIFPPVFVIFFAIHKVLPQKFASTDKKLLATPAILTYEDRF